MTTKQMPPDGDAMKRPGARGALATTGALGRGALCVLALFAVAARATGDAALAQGAGWQTDVDVKKHAPVNKPRPTANANTTIIERAGPDGKGPARSSASQLKLVALLTADGQQIDQGLIWRVYLNAANTAGKSKLVAENREASPSLHLQPGDYTINAAFGRANLTRKITIKPGDDATEKFVLNAGGLRVSATVGGNPAPANTANYSIFSDDRDQFANRVAVMNGARPGLIIRLNAGIYHIISTYGDANARVEADVNVEAGKLTEATLAHSAGRATFKLVTRSGGEALPDTHWSIQGTDGETIKDSVGALPTHVLAPGSYTVVAKAGGRLFKRKFSLKDGDVINVEVIMEGGGESPDDIGQINPSPDIKNP